MSSHSLPRVLPVAAISLVGLLMGSGLLLSPSLEAEEAVETSSKTSPADQPVDAESLAFVANKVRPLLEARCFECHGPEADEPGGGLRLDSRDTAVLGGDTGPALIPGNPHESLLIESVEYRGEYDMPPDSKMPAGEVAVLAKWIEMGAPWPAGDGEPAEVAKREPFPMEQRRARHWVWRDVEKRNPPTIKNQDFVRSPIDRYIAAGLEQQGLAPSSGADRRTLLRRAWFDLIGLPPTAEAITSFIDDPASTDVAFAKVVDGLLASPRFGERWGRHWLDLVRYAETGGHEYDYPIRHAYRYRDYVIRAFNADVPYDQFAIEHVAGDLLEEPRKHPTEGFNESVIGTGFWFFFEGQHAPVDSRGDEVRIFENQIDVFSKTFLGMTVACARCHDHKFDAISTTDYYSLAGFLKSSRRQQALLDPHDKIAQRSKELATERAQAQRVFHETLAAAGAADSGTFSRGLLAVAASDPDVDQGSDLEQSVHGPIARWQAALADPALEEPSHPLYAWRQLADAPPADFGSRKSALVQQFEEMERKAAEYETENPLVENFDADSLEGWFRTGEAFEAAPTRSGQWDAAAGSFAAIAPGVVHSGTLSPRLQGVWRSPTFTIDKRQLLYRVAGRGGKIRLIIDGYTLDIYNPLLFKGATFEVETNGQFRWVRQAQDVSNYVGHRAHIEIIDHGDGFIAVDEIRFTDGGPPPRPTNPLGKLVVAGDNAPTIESLADRYGDVWREAYAKWLAGEASKPQDELVQWALRHRLIDVDYDQLQNRLAASAQRMRQIEKTIPEPIKVVARAEGTPEDEFVLIRGNHRTPAEPAPRRLLEAIVGSQQETVHGSGRLELAERLVDPANPLTSRVIVNRIWHHLFGRGIVASVDNLGELGQRPSHPELLDHLAATFVEDGWSIKRAIRRIMLSATYQMTSKPTNERAEELDPTNALLHRQRIRRLQGEAIRDAMLSISDRLDTKMYGKSVPIHLTTFMEGRGRPDKSGPLDGYGRRSIYVEVRRNFLSPMMIAFDTPIPFGTVGRRNVSNVPAQPLILMNDPFVYQQAQVWAEHSLKNEQLSTTDRIEQLYEASYARPPSADEIAAATAFLQLQGQQRGDAADAWQADVRAWADLCHVIWNVKEFVFIH